MMPLLHRIASALGRPSPPPAGPFRALKIALVSDPLTRACLVHECHVRDLTPGNYRRVIKGWKPDLVFVESAWSGWGDAWKYKIASYPDRPERTNRALRQTVAFARDAGIPCVFWNKEDSVHFDRFIDSAALFETVFTVDENCLSRYGAALGPSARLGVLMFAVQPAIHSPSPSDPRHARACFVGSYSRHIHPRRRWWQDMMFQAARELGVTVFDRNSSRHSHNYRFPDQPWLELRGSVPHEETAKIYRDFMVSLNVNTIEDSGTMFSRRLIEILACGGVAVSNPSPAIDRFFKDYCEVVHSREECSQLFDRLRRGLTPSDRERARAAVEYVLREHTWTRRLQEIECAAL